ncbi:MAG: helix-turn-helix transcriptional regulator [Pseudomonadota bacterium]
MTPLGIRINENRQWFDLSFADLAGLTGLSVDQVTRIERGYQDRLPFGNVMAVCRALKIPGDEIARCVEVAEERRLAAARHGGA